MWRFRSMSHGGERALDRVGACGCASNCSAGKSYEGQQRVPVLDQLGETALSHFTPLGPSVRRSRRRRWLRPSCPPARCRAGAPSPWPETDFGIAFSTFMVFVQPAPAVPASLGTPRAGRPRTARAPSPMASFGSCFRPRRFEIRAAPRAKALGAFRENRRSWPTAPCDRISSAPTITRTHCFFPQPSAA